MLPKFAICFATPGIYLFISRDNVVVLINTFLKYGEIEMIRAPGILLSED